MFAALNTASFPWWQKLGRYRAWLLVGLTVLFVLAIRIHLREMPLERDEGEYAYAGQLILHGLAPYKEAYTMKLPGTYAAYAVIMAVFGQSPAGIHFGLALVNAASIVLMFLLGRKLLDEVAGGAAAVAFALLSLSPSVLGLAAHATHFVMLAALGGMLVLLYACESDVGGQKAMVRGPWSVVHGQLAFFVSGLLFGLAFLMKQHGLFFGLGGGLYLLWARIGQRPDGESPEIRPLLRDAGLFALGGFLPYGLTCLVLWLAGAFQPFVFWTITYASKYATTVLVSNGPAVLRAGLNAVVGPNIVLWILPWIGALVMWWEERLDSKPKASPGRARNAAGQSFEPENPDPHSALPSPRFFVTTFLVCSFASASVGFYFREHYFILVLPVLALLTGIAVSRGLHLLRHDTTIELFLALGILGLFVIAVGAAVIGNGSTWLGMTSPEAMRSVYGTTLFSEAARAADYIKDHSPPDARVAVLGSEPEIYFYSRRRAATGYLYMYPLMERQPFALTMQQELIAQIERTRPEFIVYVDDNSSWLQRPDSERRILDWWQDYWAKNLDLVQTIRYEAGLERGADVNDPVRRLRPGATTEQSILILQRRH